MTDVRAVHGRAAAQARSLATAGKAGAADPASGNADGSGGEFAGLFGQIADAAATPGSATTVRDATSSVPAAAPATTDTKLPDSTLQADATIALATAQPASGPTPRSGAAKGRTPPQPDPDDATRLQHLPAPVPILVPQAADGDGVAIGAPAKPRKPGKDDDPVDPGSAPPQLAVLPMPLPLTVVAPASVHPAEATVTTSAKPQVAEITSIGASVANKAPPAPLPEAQAAAPVAAGTEAVVQLAAGAIDPSAGRKPPVAGTRERAIASTDVGVDDAAPVTADDPRRAEASSDAIIKTPIPAESPDQPTGDFQLDDFVQSLPPVLQAQLGGQNIAPLNAASSASSAPTTASTGDLLGNQVIDMGVSGQWIDRMAREIAGLADGSGHSRFQLSPPHLGRIQVDLWQGDAGTSLRMTTETDEAAQRLRDGQSALAADARVAALSLSSVTVEKANAPFDSGRDQQGQRQPSDFTGQAQQQAANQGQNQGSHQSSSGQAGLNRTATAAGVGRDSDIGSATTEAAGTTDGRRVRYA